MSTSSLAVLMIVLELLWGAFLVGDLVMYFRASYDVRTRSWAYKVPGGGYVAWWRSRRVF